MSTILIIDDQPELRQLLRRALEASGYEVEEAVDGQEGMKCFLRRPADLVLTDIFMPEKDGLEIIREMRQISPGVRVIAMSGGGMMGNLDILRIARSLGAHKVLAKPFGIGDLRQTVRDALEPGRNRSEQEH
jgi:CheY-like chemotaxis protein